MRLSYPIVHLDEIIGFRVPRDSHATRYRDARMQRKSCPLLCAPNFARNAGCRRGPRSVIRDRELLFAPMRTDPAPPRAARCTGRRSRRRLPGPTGSLSRNAHRARPAHLYPPPQTRALARSSRSRLEAASRTGAARSSTGASPSTRSALRHEIAPPTRSARCLPLPSYPAALPWP